MITLKRALFYLVIHTTFLVMPSFALAASSPNLTDNFDSYTPGTKVADVAANPTTIWNGSFFDNVFVTNSGCVSGNCIGGAVGPQVATWTGSLEGWLMGSSSIEVINDTGGNASISYGYGTGPNGYNSGSLLVSLRMDSTGVTAQVGSSSITATTITGSFADNVYHNVNVIWEIVNIVGTPTCVIQVVVDGAPAVTVSPGNQTWCGDTAFNDLYNGGVNTIVVSPGTGTFTSSRYDNLNTTLSDRAGNVTTRIVSFTPEEGTTTGNDVTFALHVYVNPDDIGTFLGVQMDYRNIDQNHLLSYIPFVSQDVVLFTGQATTSGNIFFTATTSLPNGNYRVQASIKRTLIGTFINPLSNINDTQNHQFIVNQGSYLGTLNQNGFNEFNSIFGSSTATSTAAASLNCNPLTFSINLCLAFLFIPGGPQLDQSIQSFQDGVATRWPWGYFYRVYAIFTNPATGTLPSFTTDIVIGPPGNLATTSLTYDPGDMIAGAGALLETVHDNQHGKSFREVMEPFVLLMVALMVVFTIFSDITGSHKHHVEQGKLS